LRTARLIQSQQYSVYTDPYHNVKRLDLQEFDGTPLQPLYLIYSPPEMLPTSTLNPLTTATPSGDSKLRKRSTTDREVPLNWKSSLETPEVVHRINADRLWWVGLAMTGVGGMLYLGPRRMGMSL